MEENFTLIFVSKAVIITRQNHAQILALFLGSVLPLGS